MKPRAAYNSESMLAAVARWNAIAAPKWGDLKVCAYECGVSPSGLSSRIGRSGLVRYYSKKKKANKPISP